MQATDLVRPTARELAIASYRVLALSGAVTRAEFVAKLIELGSTPERAESITAEHERVSGLKLRT